MAFTGSDDDPGGVNHAATTQTPVPATCCGGPLHVTALTRHEGPHHLVELVRCSACGVSGWRLDGGEVEKSVALGALSQAFAPAMPARRAPRVRPVATTQTATTPPVRNDADLGELLAGWQVLGTSR